MDLRRSRYVPPLLGCCAVFVVCGCLRLCQGTIILPVFCRIPAEIASRYYNAGLQVPELVFSAHGLVFTVARSCAATDFFSLVTGLLTYLCIRKRSAVLALAIPPLAWVITITANTVRLILLVPATAFMYRYLPEKAFTACHQAIGTLVFLTAFILLWEGGRYINRGEPTQLDSNR